MKVKMMPRIICLVVASVSVPAWETKGFSLTQDIGNLLLGKNQQLRSTTFSGDDHRSNQQRRRPFMIKPLFVASGGMPPNLDSNDPFAILGLDPNNRDSLDKKVIKRAYKRLALKYHPDVATNRESSAEEKKRASDQFAKINAAYETLIGKGDGNFASSSSSSSSGSSAGGWTPPHRRKPGERSSYSSSSSYGSRSTGGTSWEDFMPKYDEDQYDTGGDSFGAIFADMLAGAAGSVAGGSRGGGGASVILDFVEFLERNVDGFSSGGGVGSGRGGDDDPELAFILQTGTVDEVGEELDDTELVVQQLTTKLKDLEGDLLTIQAELAASTRFSEKIALEEREAECKARKGVVENYLRKARKRLLALQTRYKQLIVGGANDSKAGGKSTSGSTWPETDSYSRSSGTAGTSNSRRASYSNNSEDSWKSEGFGSSGRGRGSSRRRASQSSQRSSSSEQSTSSSSSSSGSAGQSRQYRTTYSSDSQSTDERRRTDSSSSSWPTQQPQTTQSTSDYNVPPHRRTGYRSQAQDDKERLRQLKVDDEFEKLKRDLGL